MHLFPARLPLSRLSALCATLFLLGGCASLPTDQTGDEPLGTLAFAQINPGRGAMALREVERLRAKGRRVWCVPFARNVSGIDIRGDAKTWWPQAQGRFEQGHQPRVGAVMAFRETRRLPLGHVAVVSDIVSPRKVLIDHANWHRNQVSLGMAVIDVSEGNDWSAVRVESQPDSFGRVYPLRGFISAPPRRQAHGATASE
ncbi:CHAP domain-containing protein [Sulfitobacter aestuarii]|uniref:CHAP domain-containing protein n=1 Tax=Sulfitobacter aestuarii TaxID=2161676 RepID=A0ABW5U3N2_9RHOB